MVLRTTPLVKFSRRWRRLDLYRFGSRDRIGSVRCSAVQQVIQLHTCYTIATLLPIHT